MTTVPALPPIDPNEEPHRAASYAADEVSAWLSAPPLTREEMATAVAWFCRLRVMLASIVAHDVALFDGVMGASYMHDASRLADGLAAALAETASGR